MRSFDTVFLATDNACFVAAEYGSRERRGRRQCSQLVSVQWIVVGRRRARPNRRQIAVGKGPVGEVPKRSPIAGVSCGEGKFLGAKPRH
jgi:hypothetical protein